MIEELALGRLYQLVEDRALLHQRFGRKPLAKALLVHLDFVVRKRRLLARVARVLALDVEAHQAELAGQTGNDVRPMTLARLLDELRLGRKGEDLCELARGALRYGVGAVGTLEPFALYQANEQVQVASQPERGRGALIERLNRVLWQGSQPRGCCHGILLVTKPSFLAKATTSSTLPERHARYWPSISRTAEEKRLPRRTRSPASSIRNTARSR